ncbi:MAG: sigma-70 family RNA polymerase sigma factor [Phycisphaerales bacterium]
MTSTSQQTSREVTVVAAMSGDRDAIEALWQEHRRWIAAVLLVHKAAGDQLEDLLQDVAMTLVSKISTLRDVNNIRAWLRTVAVNAARASARRRRARPRLEFLNDDVDSDSCKGKDTTELDEEAQRVMALAQQLPEAYREPLMLRALHGMRGKHIASIMGLSEATVETRIARGRRMLRDLSETSTSAGRRSAIVGSIGGGLLRKGSA